MITFFGIIICLALIINLVSSKSFQTGIVILAASIVLIMILKVVLSSRTKHPKRKRESTKQDALEEAVEPAFNTDSDTASLPDLDIPPVKGSFKCHNCGAISLIEGSSDESFHCVYCGAFIKQAAEQYKRNRQKALTAFQRQADIQRKAQ